MGQTPAQFRRNSLHRRILLPLFIVLILVGTAITCGTKFDFESSYKKNVGDRLQAFHQVIYRELKQQELLLVTYADLLEYMQANDPGATTGILHDQIYNSLHKANIAVARYSAAAREIIPYRSLQALLDQAQQSGRPRFRLATDMGSTPTLMVAARAALDPAQQEVLVLQTPFDRNRLRTIADGFKVTPHLLSIDGALLVAGEDNAVLPALEDSELATILAGKPLFKTADARRFLFQAIPLGTTDLVVAVAEVPLGELNGALQSLTLRSVSILLLALLIGSFLYYRLVRQITDPLEEIMLATRAVGEGNLTFRMGDGANNEMGQVGAAFNSMLEKVEALQAERLASQTESVLAAAESRHRKLQERKDEEVVRAGHQLKEYQNQLSFLLTLIQATGSIQDPNLYLDKTIELIQKAVRCQNIVLLLHHPGDEQLEVRRAAGADAELLQQLSYRVDSGFIGRAIKLQEMIYLSDLQVDNLRFHYRGGTFPGGSLVCAPFVMNRRLTGVVLLQKAAAHAFSETELVLTRAISWQAAIALEAVRLREWAHDQATNDELTGLANRRFFQEILKREITQAQRYRSQFNLLLLDLDHFQRYNETHGHLCGDSALKQVATILLQNTRGIDLAARFGPDQFFLLLPKTDKNGAYKVAEKLRLRIADNCFPGVDDVQPGGKLTVSIGISAYPADARELYELIDQADRALRRAKESGRNCAQFWQPPTKREEAGSTVRAIS